MSTDLLNKHLPTGLEIQAVQKRYKETLPPLPGSHSAGMDPAKVTDTVNL